MVYRTMSEAVKEMLSRWSPPQTLSTIGKRDGLYSSEESGAATLEKGLPLHPPYPGIEREIPCTMNTPLT